MLISEFNTLSRDIKGSISDLDFLRDCWRQSIGSPHPEFDRLFSNLMGLEAFYTREKTIINILGVTGHGKSSLINKLLNDPLQTEGSSGGIAYDCHLFTGRFVIC